MSTAVTNGLDLGGQRITGLGAASAGTDAATWAQVQNIVAGLTMHNAVRLASTGNLTLTGAATVDGVAVATGDRVLVKNQTTGTQNGIYIANTAGAWTLALDGQQGEIGPGAMLIVEEGTANADTLWVMTNDGAITVGTTVQVWSKFQAGQTLTAGNGVTISNGVISLLVGAGLILDGSNVRLDPTYSFQGHKYAANIPAGATAVVINPGLGSTDVVPVLFDTSVAGHAKQVIGDIDVQSATAVNYTFASAPTAGQYRTVILG